MRFNTFLKCYEYFINWLNNWLTLIVQLMESFQDFNTDSESGSITVGLVWLLATKVLKYRNYSGT